MRNKIRRSLTFANICSALALFVALSTGTAYAANTIFSTDIVDGEIHREDLGNNAVIGAKIQNGGVGSADLAVDSVGSANILDSSIGALDLGLDSVGVPEIATDGVQASEIADGSIDGGEIIDGSLGGVEIADGSLGSADVATNSLTTADIAGADVNGSTISLAAGAVANGRCRDFPVTIGGAVAGEAVVFSIKGAVQEGVLLYGVRVPSAGTVTMKVCNLSGATMAAITNLPVRVITFG